MAVRSTWFNGSLGNDDETADRSLNKFLKDFETANPTYTVIQIVSHKGGLLVIYSIP